MSIKAKYFDIYSAPMKYCNVILALLALSCISVVAELFSGFIRGDAITIILDVAFLIVIIIASKGISKRKWYGVQWLYALFIINIITDFIIVFYGGVEDENPVISVLRLLIHCAFAIPSYFYFEHRRPLFAGNKGSEVEFEVTDKKNDSDTIYYEFTPKQDASYDENIDVSSESDSACSNSTSSKIDFDSEINEDVFSNEAKQPSEDINGVVNIAPLGTEEKVSGSSGSVSDVINKEKTGNVSDDNCVFIDCPSCNKRIKLNSNFCIYCGSSIKNEGIFCTKCGFKLLPNSKYCSKCGCAI